MTGSRWEPTNLIRGYGGHPFLTLTYPTEWCACSNTRCAGPIIEACFSLLPEPAARNPRMLFGLSVVGLLYSRSLLSLVVLTKPTLGAPKELSSTVEPIQTKCWMGLRTRAGHKDCLRSMPQSRAKQRGNKSAYIFNSIIQFVEHLKRVGAGETLRLRLGVLILPHLRKYQILVRGGGVSHCHASSPQSS